MTRSVGRDKNRLDGVVFDHLFQRFVSLFAAAGFGEPVAALGEEVGDGDDLGVRVILKPELGAELAQSEPDDSDAQFLVGERFPLGVGIDVGIGFVEALDFGLCGLVGSRGEGAAKRGEGRAKGGIG